MKVILLTDIPKIGNKYDVKEFKEGYAQNVLLSKGLAQLATPHNLSLVEAHKNKVKKQKEDEEKKFTEIINKVEEEQVTIIARANEKGHLFKSIYKKDVSEALRNKTQAPITEEMIIMEHIKEIGKHKCILKKGNLEKEINIEIKSN